MKGRYVGQNIRLVNDVVQQTKIQNIPGGGRVEVLDRETMFSQLAKRSPCVVVSG